MFFAHGIRKKENARYAISSVRLVIIFPCLLILCSLGFGDEGSEFLNSNRLADKFSLEHVVNLVGVAQNVELGYGRGKSGSEVGGGFIELGNPNTFFQPAYSQIVVNEGPNEVSEETTKHGARNTNDYFYQLIHHKDFPLLTFIWGACFGVLLLGVIFLYTQRIEVSGCVVPMNLVETYSRISAIEQSASPICYVAFMLLNGFC